MPGAMKVTLMSSSPTRPSPIQELPVPSLKQFNEEILPAARPAVFRGLALGWPIVAAAREDPHRALDLLLANASGAENDVLRLEPEYEGRFHYTRDGMSLNFTRGRGNVPGVIAGLRQLESAPRPFTMAAQGMVGDQFVPGFSRAHPMPFVPSSVAPRLWLSNAAKVATHNDPIENIAVVAIGRRRFTLFPPEAEANLYMARDDQPRPAGARVSMVHVTAPDFDRYPLFAEALKDAEEAVLHPGDAVFIPRDWWHHVEALEKFNMLVNYWWDSRKEGAGT